MIEYIFGALVLAVLFLIVAVIGLYMAVSHINKDMHKMPLLKQRFIRWGDIYKTSVLTVWLGWSGYLMYEIYNNPILLENTNDIWSNLIAVIGIIVATLIGWQIYSAMDWNSKAERISKIEDGYKSMFSALSNTRNFSEASILYSEARSLIEDAYKNEKDKKEDWSATDFSDAYSMLLEAISLYTSPSVEKPIQNCIDWMNGAIQAIQRNNVGKDAEFQNKCDELFEQIKDNKHHLTLAQYDRLKVLNRIRKDLSK